MTPPSISLAEAGAVDAHFHIWRLSRGDYGWLTPTLGDIYRDVEVADWRALAAPLGIGGGVLVQAAPTAAETEFLLQQADATPAVLGVVGWVDWLAPDVRRHIAALVERPKLKGLRPMLQDIASPDWVLQPGLAPALQAMADHSLAFDALVRPLHLPRIVELARRYPGLRIVIDHGAKPDISGDHWQPWADQLRRVAQETSAVCKWSGLLTEAGARAEPSMLTRWERHLFECFGPDRLLWGSDWPVLELAGDYAVWWQHGLRQAQAAGLDAVQQRAVFGGNARRIYRL